VSNEDTKDCTRLPVVAWQVEFPLGNGAKVYEQRPSWAYESYGDLAYVTHELCRLTDAQARLAEKNARIAQLAAHARGKNKALANALKEIERLRLNIAEYNEHESCWRAEISDLRAQLQAAPAERGVVLPEQAETPEPYGWIAAGKFFTCREDAIDAAGKTSCLEVYSRPQLIGVLARSAGRQTVAEELARLLKRSGDEVRELKASLNPAPATADSDVREVKP